MKGSAPRRIVVLGRGGAGKSTFARRLADRTGLPLTELDAVFWQEGLRPLPAERWTVVQRDLAAADRWILDGDLGPSDVLAPRLRRADTVVVMDYSLARCAWRAVRRSREAADFWRWVWGYRRRSLPRVLAEIGRESPDAHVLVLRSPRATERLLADLGATG